MSEGYKRMCKTYTGEWFMSGILFNEETNTYDIYLTLEIPNMSAKTDRFVKVQMTIEEATMRADTLRRSVERAHAYNERRDVEL